MKGVYAGETGKVMGVPAFAPAPGGLGGAAVAFAPIRSPRQGDSAKPVSSFSLGIAPAPAPVKKAAAAVAPVAAAPGPAVVGRGYMTLSSIFG